MEVSLQMIKELREMTSAGINDCKKALVEAEGDLEKAVAAGVVKMAVGVHHHTDALAAEILRVDAKILGGIPGVDHRALVFAADQIGRTARAVDAPGIRGEFFRFERHDQLISLTRQQDTK